MYDTHELAWAAGFWDGEGNSTINKRTSNGQPQVQLQLAQSGDSALLQRFQDAVGGLGSISGPYSKGVSKVTGKPFQPMYVWRTSKLEDRQQVMACMWQWLGDIKRQQFVDVTEQARAWFVR